MRRAEDPIEPGAAAALLAIDATLEGDPVDPEFAELAELALILASERPIVADDFASAMDARVARRFARPAPSPDGRRRRSRNWLPWGSLAGVAVAGVAVALVISSPGPQPARLGAPAQQAVESSSSAASAAGAGTSAAASAAGTATAASSSSSAATAAGTATAASGSAAPAPARAPHAARQTKSAGSGGGSSPPATFGPAGNRQVIQSAQLQLAAAPSKIDQVSQQVFSITAANQGIVASSNVTSTGGGLKTPIGPVPGAYAEFQLSIPSANLPQALADLSRMQGARVISRSDSTNDVTGQVGHAGIQLAEARALRRSLLKQLAAATTQLQVDSLKIQLRDADAAIASALKQLNSLKRQVAYSHVTVTIQGIVAPATSHSGGFTLGSAAHDAGRVLVVAAGVALIALAALVPVALVVALLAWIGFTIRRRRREHALDLV